jgi:dipeptidyl aminopeptidase/acylaminoacyl peptidase
MPELYHGVFGGNFMIRAGFLLAVTGLLATSAARAAPLEAYGRLPFIESVKISPDGKSLALGMADQDNRTLLIRRLADGGSQSYPMGPLKLRRIDWLGSDHLVVTTSRTATIANVRSPRSEYMMGFDLDLTAQKIRPLLENGPATTQTGSLIRTRDSDKIRGSLNILVGAPEVRTLKGVPTLFIPGISFPSQQGVLTIFRLDPKSGKPALAALGGEDTDDYVLDENGEPVAETTYDSEKGRWTLKLRTAGFMKQVRVLEVMNERPSMLGLGRDGRSIVVTEQVDKGQIVREVSLDGVWSEPLDVTDADGPIFDPDTHRLIGTHALVGDEYRYTFFNPADQAAWNAVKAAFKGDRVQLESWSADRKKIVVLADSATEGPAYAYIDMNTHRADWIGGRYPGLKPEDISKVQPIRFKAADGLELAGYLTLPRGGEAKNLPLIVFPHGGPAARDTPDFDWWAQAMASRGYAVLQVNFRGSDGYGWDFLQAGFGQWGRKMQTDLSDGVRHLAAQGVIDPKRTCIVGASYGGYAALAGVTLDPGIYRCAVSVAGLSDLKRFTTWLGNNRSRANERYFDRFIGAENRRDPSLVEVSPAAHVDRVAVPVLLIHGKDDTVVPLAQSQVMADALKKAGKPVELVVLKGEDHWLSTGETRLAMLTATIAFLEKNNPP